VGNDIPDLNIYDLLRKLIKGVARTGGMTPAEAFMAVDLINQLQACNAFGTQAAISKGNDPRE
jgi:hypothetical protein